ncbi:MAG TPA: potassium channel family protein [Candidatus Acidoferrales bacterium]|nr:potassium channel family protein [Candidatus Acidoferrales bacterium]
MTAARLAALVVGALILIFVLWEVFETIILPRRVTRMIRFARYYYRGSWLAWRQIVRWMAPGSRRETFLSYFGPLSLLGLFVVWAVALILGFALIHYSAGSAINLAPNEHSGFRADLYLSGTTFFTLGLGDVTPRTELSRLITVLEAGLGFGFLAIVISYLPVLYGAFSSREVNISLLDARAGSPPAASELLRRHSEPHSVAALQEYLHDWEIWAAELMESHLSYPVLCYFRSQHNNQSWLAALATILDTSALLVAYGQGPVRWQAKLTFAISRHAIVDLSQVLNAPPRPGAHERLPAEELQKLRELLIAAGLSKCSHEEDARLNQLRQMYEPYILALSDRLLMPVGGWAPEKAIRDNWRTSAWARISADAAASSRPHAAHSAHRAASLDPDEEEHF